VSRLGVAMLTPSYFPEVRGGTAGMVRELSSGLAAQGHAPWVLTSHPGRPARTVEDGVSVVRLPRPPDGRLSRRMLEDHLTHVPLSYAALRLRGADLAHAWFPTDALAAARWGRVTRRPSILSYTEVPDHAGLMRRRRRLEITARVARACDAVVALSQHAAGVFESSLGVGARVIYPPIDLKSFSPGPRRSEHPTILCAAALDAPPERVSMLVEAFGLVRRVRPRARLLLVQPPDPRLAQQLTGSGVELLEQPCDARARAERYREAWVTALPSTRGSFPMALGESLACGTPVVGANEAAVPEIIDREAVGKLFDGEGPELARALLEGLELAQDPGAARACRARGEDFGAERCANSYEELYIELLSR
jgi:glycosyltransferase involved in cell wall biosynthesis